MSSKDVPQCGSVQTITDAGNAVIGRDRHFLQDPRNVAATVHCWTGVVPCRCAAEWKQRGSCDRTKSTVGIREGRAIRFGRAKYAEALQAARVGAAAGIKRRYHWIARKINNGIDSRN